MRLGKTALYHFGSQVVVSLAGFLATFLIAFLLGPDGLGQYSVAVALGFFWLVIPTSAIGQAMTKRMSEGEGAREYYAGGIVLNGVLTAALVGLVAIGSFVFQMDWAPDVEFVRVLTTYDVEIAALIVGSVAFKTAQAALKGQKRVARSGAFKAIERVGRTALQVGALLLGLEVTGLIVGHAASLLIVTAAALAFIRVRPSLPSRDHLQSLFQYAKYAWLGALRGRVFGWLDTIVLSFFVSSTLIGIYEAAWGIASLLAVASGSISRTLFPEISDLGTDEEYDQIVHYLDEAFTYCGIVVIPGLFGAAIIGERVLRFYRGEFSQGGTILVILVAAYVGDVYASQLLTAVNGIDRPDVAFRVNIAFIGFNAVMNVLLVWQFGWYGAAVATAASSALRAAGGFIAMERLVGDLTIPYRELGYQVIAASVMGIAVLWTRQYAPGGRIGTLALVGLGGGIYGVSLFLLSVRVRDKARSLVPVAV